MPNCMRFLCQSDELKIHVSAYPNPTRDFTNITFEVKEAGPVKVGIYTSQGVRVGDLFEDVAEAKAGVASVSNGHTLLRTEASLY